METQNPELQKLITYRASKAKLPQVALQGPPAYDFPVPTLRLGAPKPVSTRCFWHVAAG